MNDVKIIEVESLTDLEPDPNFIVKDTVQTKWYIGDGTSTPPEIPTSISPLYANLFMLMGA